MALNGKRAVPAYTVSIPKDAKKLDRATFPLWEVFRIDITNHEYQLDIYVLPGVTPKVIGASEPEIGIIVAAEDMPPKKSAITVTYDYDGKGNLALSVQNIAMNAAAKGVIGSVVVKGKDIFIRPKELYGPRGPVESIRWYTIKYVIRDVQPGLYSLNHDDGAAEGQDREAKTELDLTSAGKGTKTVTFKDPDPSEDPFTEPPETKTEQDAAGQPATRPESK